MDPFKGLDCVKYSKEYNTDYMRKRDLPGLETKMYSTRCI